MPPRPLFPSHISAAIVDCARTADRIIRSELANGYIATENDYTSNLTCTLRREVNFRAIAGLRATSYVLKPAIERAIGSDACIILQNTIDGTFKICIFEAKWPRLSTHVNYWDSLQASTGESHFDSQLSRQKPFSDKLAIWEMFYCEYPYGAQPSFMPDYNSACVWHDAALAASTRRVSKSPWDNGELVTLLTSHGKDIGHMVDEICLCNKGERFSGNNYMLALDNYGIPKEILVVEFDSSLHQNQFKNDGQ